MKRTFRPEPRALRRLTQVALAVTAAACSSLQPDTQLDELEANHDKWESQRPADYSYAIERLCFCGIEARGPVRVTVEGSAIVTQTYVDGGAPVEGQARAWFPGVDGLFSILRSALEDGAFQVRVTYDATTGVPIDFWIDYSQNTADEELGFQVTEAVQPS